MNEFFLHYLWKYQLVEDMETVSGARLEVQSPGEANESEGPDFQNALLRIDGQLWAGNVEIHLRSSDWYVHGHEKDERYDNVILHVVWEHDVDVFRKDNSPIEILELKGKVPGKLLENYMRLTRQKEKWIACESLFEAPMQDALEGWWERLYIERLEGRTEFFSGLLQETNNDWEAVLFYALMKNFGLKVNGETFLRVARSVGFDVVKKIAGKGVVLEAVLLGQAGLLDDADDPYAQRLKDEYSFYKTKYGLNTGTKVHFFRLRPPNFPGIRLSQISELYNRYPYLFRELMQAESIDAYYDLLSVAASGYWDTHYHFGTEGKKSKKKTTRSFIDLLIINTIIPLRFHYYKSLGKDESGRLFEWMRKLPAEKNSIIRNYVRMGLNVPDALVSQALLQLKKRYCDRGNCTACRIGWKVLNR